MLSSVSSIVSTITARRWTPAPCLLSTYLLVVAVVVCCAPWRVAPGVTWPALSPAAAYGVQPQVQPQAGPPALAAAALRAPAILAKSAYLMDAGTGAALFQKYPSTRRPMASTAKIMTGLLVAEGGRLDEVATVSRAAANVGETTMGLAAGERVPVGELLYGLMLNSGNDAAIVLAEHLAGSVRAFADQMNDRAAALGMLDTQYVNPHGLDHGSFYDPGQYSSARDLALVAATAMANPVFAQVAGTTVRDVVGAPGQPPHRLRNLASALWWYPGANGVKTGWTGRAGQVRVIAAERAGTRLISVLMNSPDEMGETRLLLDYGFAASSNPQAQASVPLHADALPAPDVRLTQAWDAYKRLALAPEGRVRRGADGSEATADAQASALLYAVWFRDRLTADSIWNWTKTSLSRQRAHPGNTYRDALFASRWARGGVTDWANSTSADQRLAAALLMASRLWNEPSYIDEAKPVLEAVLNKSAVSWNQLAIPAANSFLKELEPVTTSATTLTPAFYRMFAEATRNRTWLWLLDGAYVTLEQATFSESPLGYGVGLLPSWFSVSPRSGRVGAPVDPTWQTTGFDQESAALIGQLALDVRWSGDRRARSLLAPTSRIMARELTQRQRIAAAYTRAGAAASTAETTVYGSLAGIVLLEPAAEAALRAKLEPALTSRNPDQILSAIDGLWLLAGGPPNYWRIWWPPEDVPTARNDAAIPAADGQPWRYFEQTGHVVQGAFLSFFTAHGSSDIFGLPRTDEIVEEGRSVQYFQRARLEYVSSADSTAGEVVMTHLGMRAALARGVLARAEAQAVAPFESDDSRIYVPQTGHSISGGFKVFYERNGGATVLGAPLSEELAEDGFTVQYFERGVLEYIPDTSVQSSLLGDQLLREKGWLNEINK